MIDIAISYGQLALVLLLLIIPLTLIVRLLGALFTLKIRQQIKSQPLLYLCWFIVASISLFAFIWINAPRY
jgi:hypothetical protein